MIHALFFIPAIAQSQPESPCHLRISLLTATPGTELYSTFGHSALRVVNSSDSTDLIYNYGTFDFEDPGFYSKFIKGKLLYFVSIDEFQNYMAQYAFEKRGITEQVLDLDCGQKEKLLAFLRENAKEENKYYKYDFVYDNCTTRLRDIILGTGTKKQETGNSKPESRIPNPETKDIRPSQTVTFRDLIHIYLNRSHQHWSKLGIDILLGAPLDKKLTNNEAMFLPDYLMYAFDSTTLNNKPLVQGKSVILQPSIDVSKKFSFTPFLAFGLLFLIILGLIFWGKAGKFLQYVDFLLFFFSGLIGILILFMWFGTDHLTTKNNFNLLWAFPLNLIAAFFSWKERNWLRAYFLVYCLLLLILLVCWFWGPQEMNNGLLPIVALLFLRSFNHYRRI
jgi:hypothetical protein